RAILGNPTPGRDVDRHRRVSESALPSIQRHARYFGLWVSVGGDAVAHCSSPGASGRDHHSITAAPHVRPAPKTTIITRSPRWMRPECTASSRAIATDAAEVLPYLSRLMKTCSGFDPRRSLTASM